MSKPFLIVMSRLESAVGMRVSPDADSAAIVTLNLFQGPSSSIAAPMGWMLKQVQHDGASIWVFVAG
ncbi:hypothetical protein, partial [Allosphingosinicella sp.]|uniref:hypothetical protein n=1 Tax=Allosphingosinicella sp. TaxID=2823234 RepID=UPI002F1E9A8A